MKIDAVRPPVPAPEREPRPAPEALPAAAAETAPARQSKRQQNPPRADQLDEMVEKMNLAARIFNHSLRFEVRKDQRIVIQVIDGDSGEVIRQIPPERLVDAFIRMDDALGVILDERV